MHTVGIIQARMGSRRLPGKVMADLGGQPLLAYMLDRVRQATCLDRIVVATTTLPEDDCIANLAGNDCFRGATEDVLSRYYHAACAHDAKVVVRLTADCPLIDPQLINQVVTAYLQQADQFDYFSNTLDRSFPRGMDVEVIPFQSLERVHNQAKDADEREHVTLHMRRNPQQFRLGQFHYRLTVDYPEDLELVRQLVDSKYATKTYPELLHVLYQQQQLVELNAKCEQMHP